MVLLLPVAGVVVFWLLPLGIAIPIYIVILILSGLIYWVLFRTVRMPESGYTSVVGYNAVVISVPIVRRKECCWVKVKGELWRASSLDELQVGDKVVVIGIEERLTLKIRKVQAGHGKDVSLFR